jgi:hypothetical protein
MHISVVDNYDWVRTNYKIQLLRSPYLIPYLTVRKDMQMNIAAQWLTLVIRIWEVLSFNHELETGFSN